MTLTDFIEARLKSAAEPLTAAELANMAILYGGIPESDRGRRASTAVANAMKPLRDQGLIVAGIREDERSPVYSWNPDYAGATIAETETVEAYGEPKPDALELALENPFTEEFYDNIPDPAQAQRWQRTCRALANNPRIKDSIATELYALANFLNNFT